MKVMKNIIQSLGALVFALNTNCGERTTTWEIDTPGIKASLRESGTERSMNGTVDLSEFKIDAPSYNDLIQILMERHLISNRKPYAPSKVGFSLYGQLSMDIPLQKDGKDNVHLICYNGKNTITELIKINNGQIRCDSYKTVPTQEHGQLVHRACSLGSESLSLETTYNGTLPEINGRVYHDRRFEATKKAIEDRFDFCDTISDKIKNAQAFARIVSEN